MQHAKLTVVQGDVADAAAVEQVFNAPIDAVVVALSPMKDSPPDMLARAADNIVGGMQRHGVRRLIWMTGAGVAAPEDRPKLINHLIRFALKTLAGEVLRQSEEAVRKVQASGLDWVVVRAPMLTDGPHSGTYRVGWVGVNTGPRLARADAADFMLTQLNDSTYLRQAPVVSN
jgi:putative NADH-flavin reductase